MSFQQHSVSWIVEWGDPLFDTAWNYTRLVERTRGVTTAIHRFSYQEIEGRGGINKDMAKRLRQMAQIKFKVSGSGGKKGIEHNHLVYSWRAHDNVGIGDTFLTLTTVEEASLLNLASVSKSWEADKMSDMVSQVVGESGFQLDQVEDTGEVPEFRYLTQAYQTPYHFINDTIIPRSASVQGFGGYRFFSTDGKKLCFLTPAYNGIQERKVDFLQCLNFIPKGDTWDVIKSGGLQLQSSGWDPVEGEFMEERVQALPSGIPSIDGLRSIRLPCRTGEGLKAATAAAQGVIGWDLEGWELMVLGDDKIGGDKVQLPLKLDLSSTPYAQKYYDAQQLKGFVNDITHELSNGGYTIKFNCSTVTV